MSNVSGVLEYLKDAVLCWPGDEGLRILAFTDRPLGRCGYEENGHRHPRSDRDYSGAYKHYGGRYR